MLKYTQKYNPLQKLFEDLDDVEHKIKDKQNDIIFGCLGAIAKERAEKEMILLLERRTYLNRKVERAKTFFQDLANKTPNITLGKKERDRYIYFNNTLKSYEFRYTPPDVKCTYCGRLTTSRTGIVYTLDPVTNELVDICANCYIDRKQSAS